MAGGDRICLYCLHSQFMTLLNVSHDSCWWVTPVCVPHYCIPPGLAHTQTLGVMVRSDSSVSLWVTCWKLKRAQTSKKGGCLGGGWLKRLCPLCSEWGEPQGWSGTHTSPLTTLSSFFSSKCALYFNRWSQVRERKKRRPETEMQPVLRGILSLILVQQLHCVSGCLCSLWY